MSDRTDIETPPTGLLPETQVEEQNDTPRAKSPREEAMERIAAKYERQRANELGIADERTAEEPEHQSATRPLNPALGEVEEDRDYRDPYAVEAAPEPVVDVAPQGVPHRQELPQPPAPVPAGPQTFAIDLDGQQIHVTQEQLLALGRMGAIANRELYRYQTQAPQQFQPGPVVQAPTPAPQPALDQDQINRTVKAIQYGDEASAGAALSELITHVTSRTPQAPQIDAVAIGNYAAQKARLEAKLEHETGVIRQEYADVMDNRYLANMAATRVAEIRQRNQSLGQNQSDLEVYREAGDFVLETIGKPRSGQQAAQPADAGSTAPQAPNIVVRRAAGDIDARKRAAPRAMSQVIDRRSPAPQAPRPPTGTDVVEWMRKGRGQTSMR